MESLLQKIIATENLDDVLYSAVRDKKITGYTYEQKIQDALRQQILTEEQAQTLLSVYSARLEILAVDDFLPSELEERFPSTAKLVNTSTSRSLISDEVEGASTSQS
jgi:hypothetical protein